LQFSYLIIAEAMQNIYAKKLICYIPKWC